MKKYTATLFIFLISMPTLMAQPPQALTYKALINTSIGNMARDRKVTIRFSLLLDSENGSIQYQEVHNTKMDFKGYVSVNIGEGNPMINTFEGIDWGLGDYFLKVEIDPKGGTNFHLKSISQLLSVPYSLYAGTARTSEDRFSGDFNDLTNIPADIADGDDDTYLTESDVDFYVSNNGFLFEEVDGSITNEIELPPQAGQSGKILSTNGLTPTWIFEKDPVFTRWDKNFNDLSNKPGLGVILSTSNDGDNKQIKNIEDPTEPQDAVTKAYVDSLEAQMQVDLLAFKTEIKTDLTNLETQYKTDITTLETQYKTDLTVLKTQLSNEITNLEIQYKTDIVKLENQHNAEMEALEEQLKEMEDRLVDAKVIARDEDGNVYSTVTICDQVWMAENLKTTMYNDGTPIPLVTDSATWSGLDTPAYTWYNNDSVTYADTYGALYNWHTVDTDKLCPVGWHVPTKYEWQELFDCVGGTTVAGGRLKEADTTHWFSPNTDAIDKYGFTALPGGKLFSNSTFNYLGEKALWWTTTEKSTDRAYFWYLSHNNGKAIRDDYNKKVGLSVRCVAD